MTVQPKPDLADEPTLLVFGRDEAGKAHACWLAEGEARLAQMTAGAMNLRFLPVRTEAEQAPATRVPKGRVLASGEVFVPVIEPALFVELQAASLKSGVTALRLAAAAHLFFAEEA